MQYGQYLSQVAPTCQSSVFQLYQPAWSRGKYAPNHEQIKIWQLPTFHQLATLTAISTQFQEYLHMATVRHSMQNSWYMR
jgi:predicted Zn-dependent protease